jgi:hypothetical protein
VRAIKTEKVGAMERNINKTMDYEPAMTHCLDDVQPAVQG